MLGIGLTLLIEMLMLVLLLTLGTARRRTPDETRTTLVTFRAEEAPHEAPAPRRREPERQAVARPTPQQAQPVAPPSVQSVQPVAPPVTTTVMPTTWQLSPGVRHRPDRPAAATGPAYGPPNIGSPAAGDSEQVGTAPNGEPLFAAQWYEEPSEEMMRSYLSTARGPGWGLIACRTAPDYRVEDCVALDEYPEGSQINRSVLAAAWEFRVRPPRRGGQSLVGAWVRIRIDYDLRRHGSGP